ncbi:MAG: DUF4234 domain-containing protein [Oscillibacter sp.]|nr:DUF4234 domain-containing protein [Oscillibacter sp.]
MKCWKCGAELPEGVEYCGSCGTKQAQYSGNPFAGPTPSAPPPPGSGPQKPEENPGSSGGQNPGEQPGGPNPGEQPGGPNPGGPGGGYNGGPGGGDQKIVLTVFAAVCGAVYGLQALSGGVRLLRQLFQLIPGRHYFGLFGPVVSLFFSALFTATALWMCLILLMLAFRRTRQNSDGLILCLGSGAAAIVILRVLYMPVCLIVPSMRLNFSVYLSTLLLSIAGAAIALGGVYCILRFLMGEMPLAGKTTADFQNDVREAFQSSARAAGEAGAQAARAAQNARNDWNARQTQVPPPAGGGVMRLKADRSLLVYILLNFITCGIYGLYFIYALARDVNVVCAGDGRNTAGLLKLVLFSFLTCGLYGIFWYYSLGNRLAYNAPRYGLNFQENGTTILLWYLVGLLLCGLGPLVALYIIIKNTNALCGAYNYSHGM